VGNMELENKNMPVQYSCANCECDDFNDLDNFVIYSDLLEDGICQHCFKILRKYFYTQNGKAKAEKLIIRDFGFKLGEGTYTRPRNQKLRWPRNDWLFLSKSSCP